MGNFYGVNEIRAKFLEFFKGKEHYIMKSFSLVPKNDKSLLLINSGMAPLKPYFTGQERPPKNRVATCQTCIRTGDIEHVGKTARHGTFFEMLGNFSFGDYFKREAISWTWEFLTLEMGLEAERLYPSVYLDDDEAFDIWNKEIGIPKERIYRFGKEDNFWEHGSGPCGPCSEVYYDRGEKYGCHKKDCKVGCDCDRYMEVWNDVFTQFNSDGKGNYTELEQKNIDTGMGLERLAVVVQEAGSIFEVDTVKAILDEVAHTASTAYNADSQKDISLRLITDHIRSCTFMISDGIMPSNEGRGYVLRRLLRRAARHGRILGINKKFLADLAVKVIDTSKEAYPGLDDRKEMILKVLAEEEERFYKNIDNGLVILAEMKAELNKKGEKTLGGEDAFKLYDTYGFPYDLTKEILEEDGYLIDEAGFSAAMDKQRKNAREARKETNYMGADVTVYQEISAEIKSEFTGYGSLSSKGKILVIAGEEELTAALTAGERGTIITDITPFYAAMGGQSGDKGIIVNNEGSFVVEDCIKIQGNKTGHVGYVKEGLLRAGTEAELEVDRENREETCKNHSATHLLHKALRNILGKHVEQAGSLVEAGRLRFDFTHFSALTAKELEKVEDEVNAEIKAALKVETDIMDIEAAKQSGAMALFGEKYGEKVRVVSMGDYSKELCGGTHVKNTSEIAEFKILSESGIAAGVRRIEAITSNSVQDYYRALEIRLNEAAKELKTAPANIAERIKLLLNEVKQLKSENESLKAKIANENLEAADTSISEINGIKVLALCVEGVEMNELRNLGDSLKAKTEEGVIILASTFSDRASLIVMAGKAALSKGADAGKIIKRIAPLVEGGGGGRSNMAQAGGKNPQNVLKALEEAKKILSEELQ